MHSTWRYKFVLPAILLASLTIIAQPVQADTPRAVSTYESIGVYWPHPTGTALSECTVKFRVAGTQSWRLGYPLWYDARNDECRGSLVELSPGTRYDIQVEANGAIPQTLQASTWAEHPTIGQTIYLPSQRATPLDINVSGSANAYVLYTYQPGNSTTIDVANAYDTNININASYVIVRGLTLRNAKRHGIVLGANVHDVIIENNDISGWGRPDTNNNCKKCPDINLDYSQCTGVYFDSAIYSSSNNFTLTELTRITIQRNRLHDPRFGANNWSEPNASNGTTCEPADNPNNHPVGPQAITFFNSAGNHVIRNNEISTTENKCFNDALGAGDNFSDQGFPGADSDIYGNYIAGACDDGIESEGGNRNVRIWNNFIDRSFVMIAAATTHSGPLYIWRNISGRSRKVQNLVDTDSVQPGYFLKIGNREINGNKYGDGRINVFHNTLLQPAPGINNKYGLGVSAAIVATNGAPKNVVSRNNIFMNWTTGGIIGDPATEGLDFDYDIYSGCTDAYTRCIQVGSSAPQEVHGIPLSASQFSANLDQFAPGNFFYPKDIIYPENTENPAVDLGIPLPGFNDFFLGAAPDHGALEKGQCLVFGVTGGCTDLAVTATVDSASVLINDNVIYTVTIQNNGPSIATSVTLTDTLPAGMSFFSVSPSTGCTTGQTITCKLASLAHGATATVIITAKAITAGAKTNTTTVSNVEKDPNPVNNTTTATTTVLPKCANGSYKITGVVKKNSSSGTRIGGVVVRLNGTSCGQLITTNTQNNDYTFTGLKNGSYTLTPNKSGCTFTPTNRSVTINNSSVSGWSKTGFAGSGTSCN